jgi:hypothetical protein
VGGADGGAGSGEDGSAGGADGAAGGGDGGAGSGEDGSAGGADGDVFADVGSPSVDAASIPGADAGGGPVLALPGADGIDGFFDDQGCECSAHRSSRPRSGTVLLWLSLAAFYVLRGPRPARSRRSIQKPRNS